MEERTAMIFITGEEYVLGLHRIERTLKNLVGNNLKARQIRFVEAALFNVRLSLAMGALKSEYDSLDKAVYGYGHACMLFGMATAIDNVELIKATKTLKESIGFRVDILLSDRHNPPSLESRIQATGEEQE